MMAEERPLFERMREQFRKQQLEKNAESVRTHHPEYRRHQKAISDEIEKVEKHFAETLQDRYIAAMPETLFHFKQVGHPTNLYEYPLAPGATEPKVAYEIHRKAETPQQREARIRAWHEKNDPKPDPTERDEDDDYYD